MKKIFLIALLLLASASIVNAHSGRTDSSGGHNCRTGSCAGTYHYHNGGSTPSPYVAPIPTYTYSRQTEEAQKQLNKIYGYSLSEDGKLGPTTEDAIKTFQRKVGLVVTGSANSKTLEVLNSLLIKEEEKEINKNIPVLLSEEKEHLYKKQIIQLTNDLNEEKQKENSSSGGGIGTALLGAGAGYFIGKRKKQKHNEI